MIYPKDFENKIGFNHLRLLLLSKCETEMGKKMVENMSFKSNIHTIRKELLCVNEMKILLSSSISLPQFIFYDIAGWLKECRSPGSFMSVDQIYHTGVTFKTMKEIRDFFTREGSEDYPQLKKEFCAIPVFDDLYREITRCIDKEGNIKDSASIKLSEIRISINNTARSIHKIMRRVLDSSINNGIIDKETTPVIRDGRLVIPVSSANKRSITGIVHDTSATGKTVFIEPSEVLEAGNRLRELEKEEEIEIIAILTSLTDQIRPYYQEINEGCRKLAGYDFIKAKAIFAIETGGELPKIENEPELDWYHAVHPGLLLNLRAQGREVIAMNLKLDKERRILIISGPNAGGKSVSLKTVGTIQYMIQCGMLPTLYSNSHVGIFSNIFIDIGDEQSMENDLSTYSSHLANMKYFLQNANDKTLILADEMGSGTEPQIGAALAQSILRQLGETGCFGIITTHYRNLKVFAENNEGFINGAMLYDRQQLRPTFQLSVGEPGSSFALEIAKNIGLPENVIEEAKDLVGTDYVDSEKFILDIQRDKRYWKNKRLEIKEKENRLNKLLEEYEDKAEELKKQRSSILKEARQEAQQIIQGANTQIERSIHEIRKFQAEKENTKRIRREIEDYKKTLETADKKDIVPDSLKPLKHKSKRKLYSNDKDNSNNLKNNDNLKIGDYVKMDNGGITGQIIGIQGNKAEVAFGNLRTSIDIKKLKAVPKPQSSIKENYSVSAQSVSSNNRERQLNFSNEIDVRGFRADEALQAITYFLDDAIQFNSKRIRILHGTGHGILRTLIREQLKSNPNIKDFHDEDVRFGGAGITVIDLE